MEPEQVDRRAEPRAHGRRHQAGQPRVEERRGEWRPRGERDPVLERRAGDRAEPECPELRDHHVARRCMRHDDRDRRAGEVRQVRRERSGLARRIRGRDLDADAEVKRGAPAQLALDLDRATHQLDEALADDETEPGAAELPVRRGVGLRERAEQPRALLGSHPDPFISHLAQEARAIPSQRDRDRAALRKLERVADEVEQHLPETRGIADQPARHVWRDHPDERDLSLLRASGREERELLEHVVELERDALELDVPGIHLGEVEHVVDEGEQVIRGALDLLQVAALARRRVAGEREIDHAQDRGHRRAQLVAHVRHELRLHAGGLLGLGERLLALLLEAGEHRLRLIADPHVRRDHPVVDDRGGQERERRRIEERLQHGRESLGHQLHDQRLDGEDDHGNLRRDDELAPRAGHLHGWVDRLPDDVKGDARLHLARPARVRSAG